MTNEVLNRHLLLILDGYGIAEDPGVSAIDHAHKPYLDALFARYPHSTLEASGLAVGLPAGQMGNSEVGHMNLGAGRVVYQDITRIDKAIEEGDFFENEVLKAAVDHAKQQRSKLHLLGCFSDGGVHSSLEHLAALLELTKRAGLEAGQVCIHAFTDGRDTDPEGGAGYVRYIESKIEEIGVGGIATVIGRYFAMDRDQRWERTRKSFDLLTKGTGTEATDAAAALEASYEAGVTDEFVEPIRVMNEAQAAFSSKPGLVEDGDTIIFFNFRADRGRQLTRAFTQAGFDGFDRGEMMDLHYVTLTPYDKTFDVEVAFPKINLVQTLGELIAAAGGRQLRAAETEKYPHVTFFFSGGREEPFEGEDRILVPSPKVPTYDLQPEMSAPELGQRVAEALKANPYTFAVLNFANPDMVGHTGVFEAAVKAVEAVDEATGVVVDAALEAGYSITIIADHGNSDKLRNPDGSPHTAHTTALVPHMIIKDGFEGPIRPGKLGDVAPTIMHILGMEIPEEMDGNILI